MSDLCPHFGECGGCQHQNLTYAEQVARKQARLQDLFAPFWNDPIPVTPSPILWHYRNKVDFAFGLKWYPEPPPEGFVRESLLGFKAQGRWYRPMDIEKCLIGPEGTSPLLAAVRSWMRDNHLSAFDARTGKGFLRALLVREGQRTGDRLVALITGDGDLDTASFVDLVQRVYPAKSIYRGIFRGRADVAAAEETQLLQGDPTINECLHIKGRELLFRISPFSFFQTNTLATELLYTKIRQWASDIRPDVLYDLYGGAGGIAFTCSDLARRIISVENVPSATHDGIYNAGVNAIDNVEFLTEKVDVYLKQMERIGLEPNCAVVADPPRCGMQAKAVRRLIRLRPPHILYVSCKPSVLPEELPAFLQEYELTGLQAVDLFPHTDHVEVLASLRLRSTP